MDVSTAPAAAREAYGAAVRYFENHAKNMDYPRYLENGWPIGSGPVESTCKNAVKRRLDGCGMRWRPPGSDAVCRLRALKLSGADAWEALWYSAA